MRRLKYGVERCIIVIAPLRAKFIWTRKVAMVSIAISYSSINFIIYIISNKRFRREYKELLSCGSQKLPRNIHASKYSLNMTSSSTLPKEGDSVTSQRA
ncbi:uncharacterized protein LOC126815303 [Patella vulgata]|uniref:uncharacterized protein LOC126815303 n=1 Tax=Patella vulgata TaxID=6465 RepID=UPI0024A888B3|nr:uncharacterized protein LOC126815303 [Patella vulgata]